MPKHVVASSVRRICRFVIIAVSVVIAWGLVGLCLVLEVIGNVLDWIWDEPDGNV